MACSFIQYAKSDLFIANCSCHSMSLLAIIDALSDAQPDSEAVTRAKPDEAPAGTTHTTTPSGPNKRRKEAHDSSVTNGANGHLSSPTKTPVTQPKAKTPPASTRSTPSRTSKGRKAPSPAPSTGTRRSARASTTTTLPRTAEGNESEEETAKAPLPNPEEDIAESKMMVERLKKDAKQSETAAKPAIKRTREEAEAPLTLNLDQPQDVVHVPPSERALVSNKRIAPRWPTLQPSQKSAAWGAIAFAIGWGAT
jgi:hypothetical protein